MKDHEIRELVNLLTKELKPICEYGCLREKISKVVVTYLHDLQDVPKIDPDYKRPVKFKKTNLFGSLPKGYVDDVYTVKEFVESCVDGSFTDYDGWGYPVKDSKANTNIHIYPSTLGHISKDATHIVWFNK